MPPSGIHGAPVPMPLSSMLPPMPPTSISAQLAIPPQPMMAPIPSGAPMPTVSVAPQIGESVVEEVDHDVVMEDVTVKKSESNDDSKEKEAKLDPQPEAEPEVNPLEILMECILKCRESSTLKMTMKGWNKKASIELRFTFSGTLTSMKRKRW